MKKEKNLHYPKSIEKYLITKIPIVKENASVKSVLSMLEKIDNKYDSVDYVYVINNKGNLKGMFYVQELFNNPKNTSIKKFMKRKIITVSLSMEIEKVAHLALKHNLKQIPVIESKKLIGAISSRQILFTINKSLRTDIFHFAGIHKSHLDFNNSLEIPLLKVFKDRLSWLIFGLVGAILIAVFIGFFENTLARYLVIASFIPAVVYISGALGTQLQTVFVRDLAILGKEIRLKRYFLRQILVTFLIASSIGIILFLCISLFWKERIVAFAISLASFFSLQITSFTALIITLLIKRFRFDPALGSGPVVSIISDMTSIIIYFLVVVLLL